MRASPIQFHCRIYAFGPNVDRGSFDPKSFLLGLGSSFLVFRLSFLDLGSEGVKPAKPNHDSHRFEGSMTNQQTQSGGTCANLRWRKLVSVMYFVSPMKWDLWVGGNFTKPFCGYLRPLGLFFLLENREQKTLKP